MEEKFIGPYPVRRRAIMLLEPVGKEFNGILKPIDRLNYQDAASLAQASAFRRLCMEHGTSFTYRPDGDVQPDHIVEG